MSRSCCSRRCSGEFGDGCIYCGDNCITYWLCEDIGGGGTNIVHFFRRVCDNGEEIITTNYEPHGTPYIVSNEEDVGTCPPSETGTGCIYCGDDCYVVQLCEDVGGSINHFFRLTCDNGITQINIDYNFDGTPYVVTSELNVNECGPDCEYCEGDCVLAQLCEEIDELVGEYAQFWRLTCDNGTTVTVSDFYPDGTPYVVNNELNVGTCPLTWDFDWFVADGTANGAVPHDIQDNVYTRGLVGINQNPPITPLDVTDVELAEDGILARFYSSHSSGANIYLEHSVSPTYEKRYIRFRDDLLEIVDDAYNQVIFAQDNFGNIAINHNTFEDWHSSVKAIQWETTAIFSDERPLNKRIIMAKNVYHDGQYRARASDYGSYISVEDDIIINVFDTTPIGDIIINPTGIAIKAGLGNVNVGANSGLFPAKLNVIDDDGIGAQLLSDIFSNDLQPQTTIRARTSDSASGGIGGSIGFTGWANGVADLQVFSLIHGYKENSTSGNHDGGLRLRTYNHANGWNDGVTLNSDNHVGIGKTVPETFLDIEASTGGNDRWMIQAKNTDNSGASLVGFRLYDDDDEFFDIVKFNSTYNVVPANAGMTFIRTNSQEGMVIRAGIGNAGNIHFLAGKTDFTTETLLFLEGANQAVGINTINPISKLDIRGVAATEASGITLGLVGDDRLAIHSLGGNSSAFKKLNAGGFIKFLDNSDNPEIVIDNVGKVTIGPNNPAVTLDIYGTNSDAIRLRGTADTVEIADIYVGANGELIIDQNNNTGSTAFIDIKPKDDSFGIVLRNSVGGSTTPYANFYMVNDTIDYLAITITRGQDNDGFVFTESDYLGVGIIPEANIDIADDTDANTEIRIRRGVRNSYLFLRGPEGAGYSSVIGAAQLSTGTRLECIYLRSTNDSNFGNVGIRQAAPTHVFEIGIDDAAKPTTNTWTIVSDERIKKDVETYTLGLDEILKIRPVWFRYNGAWGQPDEDEKDYKHVGVIAQEIINILPGTVNSFNARLYDDDEEDTEILGFNSHEIIFALINAVKELNDKIERIVDG